MKNAIKVVLVIAVLGALVAFAANRVQAGHGKSMDVEKHLKKMTKKFNLTPEQQAEVRKVLEEKKQKMEEVWKQVEDAGKDYGDKVRAILNDNQKAKFDKKMAKYKKRHSKDCCVK